MSEPADDPSIGDMCRPDPGRLVFGIVCFIVGAFVGWIALANNAPPWLARLAWTVFVHRRGFDGPYTGLSLSVRESLLIVSVACFAIGARRVWVAIYGFPRPGIETDGTEVYCANRMMQVGMIVVSVGSGVVVFAMSDYFGSRQALETLLLWSPGGALPDIVPILLVALGLISCGIALQNGFYIGGGLPRLTVTREAVTLETPSGFIAGTRKSWAKWNSLTRFDLTWIGSGPSQSARAGIAIVQGIETSADLREKMKLVIYDSFDTPLEEIIANLNSKREQATGASAPAKAPPRDAAA